MTTIRSQAAVAVQIDASLNRHLIDARIYGVAHADAAALADLKIPFHRWGGNASTRYNWQANASNRAADWFFESIADGAAVAGASADTFVSQSKTNGAEPIITIPTLGWVAKVGATRNNLASFSIAKYGAQTGSDAQWFADAGNGVSTATGRPITGNDPNDASAASDATFQRGWVQHLVTRWGPSSGAGVKYYAIDNEPSLWHGTHRDVHPNGASMDEVFNNTVAYATQIKAVDPGALVLGPEEWGWSGYLYSGKDQQWGGANGWTNLPDRTAHANADYLPWFLAQMRSRDAAAGQRLLDIFTVHYYPQAGQYGNDTSTAMQQLRNRSTRALWDQAYVDESWIATQVQLIPRLKGWVTANYPGTKIGITEYNWGAENHINGATTQADILGIFGREALDVATFWTFPAASTPTYKAIKLYRNYDGQGSAFGNTSVSATAPNPDALSVFAAQRSTDNALTIMAVNKDLTNSPAVNLNVANFSAQATAQVWRLTSSNTIARLADAPVSAATISTTLPAQSITLFVLAAAQAGTTPAAPTNLRVVSGSAGAPASVTANAGTPQGTVVSTAFGTALKALVRDANSTPVSGTTVTFTAPASGATARFGSSATATAVTDANGIATAPTLSANATQGAYTVSATVAGVGGSAAFTLTNVAAGGPGGTWVNVTPPQLPVCLPFTPADYGLGTVGLSPILPTTIYLGTDRHGIYKSINGGDSWVKINTGTNGQWLDTGGQRTLAVDPINSNIVYTVSAGGQQQGIFKSVNGGVDWTQMMSTSLATQTTADVYSIAIDPLNHLHLLVGSHSPWNFGTNAGVLESLDGGQNWIVHPSQGPWGAGHYVFFLGKDDAGQPSSAAWILATQGNGYWRTMNSGATWTQVSSTEQMQHGAGQLYRATTGVLYMGAVQHLLRSTDNGKTWAAVGPPNTPDGYNAVIGDGTYLYAQPTNTGVATSGLHSYYYSLESDGLVWRPYNSQTFADGPQSMVFDAQHRTIYSSNWCAGFWRLATGH